MDCKYYFKLKLIKYCQQFDRISRSKVLKYKSIAAGLHCKVVDEYSNAEWFERPLGWLSKKHYSGIFSGGVQG